MAAKTSTTRKRSTFKPLDEIEKFLRRFVVFSDADHARVLSLWVLHTWTFDAAYATPYIYVNSAEPQSGKTRTMEVVEQLAYNAVRGSGITTSTLFRMIERDAPTVFIDEVDTIFTGAANEELRGCLNSGYRQGGNIWRTVGGEPEQFNTFCPKMLAGIDNAAMPDTLRDRCIPIILKRKKTDQEVERFVPRKLAKDLDTLKENIRHWAATNMDRILDMPDPAVIDGISDRAFEIAEPLLILAAACGREYVKPTRDMLGKLMAGQKPKASLGIRTLEAAKEIMDESGADRIMSSVLAAKMGVTPKKLGAILAPYGITPSTIRQGDQRAKGYHRVDFTESWEIYL